MDTQNRKIDKSLLVKNMTSTFKTLAILVLMSFLGTSCIDIISEMEKLVGMPMKEALTPVAEENKWYEFNGDGYKIKVYEVKRNYLERYYTAFKSKGFKGYNPASWKQSEMYKYIKDSHGLYKRFAKNNEEIYVFLNMDTGMIIYYYELL